LILYSILKIINLNWTWRQAMNYYKITLHSIPLISFAHRYMANNYRFEFAPRKGFIEITYIEQGDILKITNNGEKVRIPTSSVLVNLRDQPGLFLCQDAIHRHSTVGFEVLFDLISVDELQIAQSEKLALNNPQRELFAVVPEFLTIVEHNKHIESLIQKIISFHSIKESSRELICSGMCLELLSELSRECLRISFINMGSKLSPGSVLYSRKAMNYISAHINQKIAISDIADNLEISEGYLCNTFKKVTGQTLVEYINRIKINQVKEMILSKNITFKQAGESVGIEDENYLSRIFSKYNGISMRKFKLLQVKNGD
jgi:AraC-like DNA-binding protein